MSIFDPIYRQNHLSGQVARTLFTIGKAIKHLKWEKSKSKHLTPTQIQTLVFLKYIRPDAATVNTLAKYLSCTPSTVSGVLDTLESKKLILRNRKGDDKRQVLLTLTLKGLRDVRAVEDLGKEIEKIIADFSEDEQELLDRMLLRISKKLIDKSYISLTDICATCCFFEPQKYRGSEKPHYCKCLNIVLSEKDIYKECPDYKESLN